HRPFRRRASFRRGPDHAHRNRGRRRRPGGGGGAMTLSDGMEMFFVRPRPGDEDTARDQIATFAATLGGVVLMTTDGGALVLGMPLGCKDALAAHGSVAFVGGVSFGDGPGVEAFQQR